MQALGRMKKMPGLAKLLAGPRRRSGQTPGEMLSFLRSLQDKGVPMTIRKKDKG